jgi:hypothetical protein
MAYGFNQDNFADFGSQFGHAAGRHPTRMGGGLAMPTPAPDAPDVSYPGMSFAPQQHQNPPPAMGGPGAGSYPGMPGMGGPAHDAGGLNPLQRSLFLRSVAFNNSGLSKNSDAGRDFLLAPFAGDNYTMNRGLATQQANDASDANAANVGAVNAGTQRTNTLTPLIGQGVATANRGQAIQNNLAEQSIPLITGNMQGQNQQQALHNQFYPGMAGSEINAMNAQADALRQGAGNSQRTIQGLTDLNHAYAGALGLGVRGANVGQQQANPAQMSPMEQLEYEKAKYEFEKMKAADSAPKPEGFIASHLQLPGNMHPSGGQPQMQRPMQAGATTQQAAAAPQQQGGGKPQAKVGDTGYSKTTGKRYKMTESGWQEI